jgi:hypothetical protein
MKMLKVALVVLVMAAMVTPVIAEDRLSLNGEMRVRGWHKDRGFDNFTDSDGDYVQDPDNTETYGDQRLRIGGKIAVAEGVSITFRTDITESNWGTTGGGNGFGSGRSGSNQQWDRAHIDQTAGSLHLRAGQFYQAYGKTYALDSQDNGLSADYVVGNGSINAFFMLNDNNASAGTSNCSLDQRKTYTVIDATTGLASKVTNPEYGETVCDGNNPYDPADKAGTKAYNALDTSAGKANNEADAFLAGAKYSGKFDNIALNVFVGNQTDGDEESVTLVGADVTIPLDAFKIVAELDFFDGDSAKKNVDAYGTQFMLDGSFAASDAFTIGGAFFYGLGDDEDTQYTNLGNGFGGWDPVMDIGSSLSNEQIAYGSPFNVASIAVYENTDLELTSAGSVGGRLYTNYMVNDDFTLGATVGYFVSEEDKIADLEVATLAGGFVYKLMENTSIQWQLQYISGTANQTHDTAVNGDIDFDAFEMGSGLFVKF